MKGTSNGKTFTAVAVTVTWAVVIPFEVLFFTRVVKWPLDLTILMLLPIVVIWVPGSCFRAVAALAIWLYAAFRSGSYVWSAMVAVIVCLCVCAVPFICFARSWRTSVMLELTADHVGPKA